LLSHLSPLRPPTALPPLSPTPFVVLRCADPKTILIDLTEGKEQPVPFIIKSQTMLDELRRDNGALGLMNGTRRAVLTMEELVDGSVYTFVHDMTSGLTKLRGGVEMIQGTLKTLDEAFEQDVSPCPVVLSLSFLTFFLPPSSILSFAHSYTLSFTFRRRANFSSLP
jgi:hypothetical protein